MPHAPTRPLNETPAQLQLLAGTNNPHKAREIAAILDGLPVRVLTPRESGITEDPEESGETFEENAFLKARFFANASGLPCLSDDSGLVVDALGGRPGIRSSRYAPTDPERIERLLDEMRGVPEGERAARFVCAVALVVPPGWNPRPGQMAGEEGGLTGPSSSISSPIEIVEIGLCEGAIATAPRGTGGFGYDPVFYLPDAARTMAELTAEEKNARSHRGRALRAMKPHLRRLFLAPS